MLYFHSDLNLITNKGNVYSFLLDDDESAEPDLKVVIEPSDPSSIAATEGAAKWVPASEVKSIETQAKAARRHDADAVEAFRSDYPTQKLKFDYTYKSKRPFDVSAIYHDDRFTYNLYAQAVTDTKRTAQSKIARLVFDSGKTSKS